LLALMGDWNGLRWHSRASRRSRTCWDGRACRFPKTFPNWPKRSCRSQCSWALGQLE
jgi:hypothetical protein